MRPFAFVNPHVGGVGKASWEGERMECVDTDFIVGVSLDESESWNLLPQGHGLFLSFFFFLNNFIETNDMQ